MSEKQFKRLFRHLYPWKLLWKISLFFRKTDSVIWFSVIKISTPTNLMRFTIKTDIINMWKSEEFRWGNDSKNAIFHFFFSEKPPPLKKKEKCYSIFYYKNRNAWQFHALTIKNDFGNLTERGEFKFENNLNESFNF